MRARIASMLAVALLVGAVTIVPSLTPTADPTPAPGTQEAAGPRPAPRTADAGRPTRAASAPIDEVRLRTFSSCRGFAEHVRARAIELVGPHGLDQGWSFGWSGFAFGGDVVTADATFGAGAGAAIPAMPGLPPPAPAFSGTNVQVAGVDEPDILKTDGRTIFWLGERSLHAVAVDDEGSMQRAGSIELGRGHGHQMLLAGTKIIVLSPSWVEDGALRNGTTTRIAVIDASDPEHMTLAWEAEIEGDYLTARLIDGTVRLVVRSGAPRGVTYVDPMGWTGPDVTNAIERNKRRLARTDARDWLPRISTLADGERTTTPLVPCESVHIPKAFGGFDTVSVLTLDPDAPQQHHAASVLGGGQTVYATADSLFVATTEVVPVSERDTYRELYTTKIHSFDISSPAGAVYRASGQVEGSLKDQWAMDVHDGHLRVASTLGPPWEPRSESIVTVLREEGGRWNEVGSVGGLGRGERIYAVRFMGARGYVVTFRLIDPLYTLDLSVPEDPRVVGELKIPGYSAYLHPVDEHTLVGIGQAASARGATFGTQVSLFDVADPARPRRMDRLTFGLGNSEAEFDHHAFTFWPATGTLVLPLREYGGDRLGTFTGAVGIRVEKDTLTEVARVSHQRGALDQLLFETYRATIRRSAVVGETVYTLSAQGMLANDVRTFEERGWLPWMTPFRRAGVLAGRQRGDADGWQPRFDTPSQIALGYDGNLWVADRGNRAIRRLSIWDETRTMSFRREDGSTFTQLPDEPVGLAPTPSGDLWIATRCGIWRASGFEGASLRLIAGAQSCGATDDLLGPRDGEGTSARFGAIGQIARLSRTTLLITDAGAHAVRRLRLAGDRAVVETIAGVLGEAGFADGIGAEVRLRSPQGIAVLPGGRAAIADRGNHVVRELDLDELRMSTLAGVPARPSAGADRRLTAPTGLAFDPVTGRLYVSEGGAEGARGHRVRWLRDGRIGSVAGEGIAGLRHGPAARARFDRPSSIVIAGEQLIVADTGNHRLRWVR